MPEHASRIEAGKRPRSNIQAVEAQCRGALNNLSTRIAFDSRHEPSMAEHYDDIWRIYSTWRGATTADYLRTSGTPLSESTRHVIVGNSYRPIFVNCIDLGNANTVIAERPTDLVEAARSCALWSVTIGRGLLGAGVLGFDRQGSFESPLARQTVARHAAASPTDLAETAARIVAEVRDMPTPDIYSTNDGGLVLDFAWKKARLSCVLRPHYAHVMFFNRNATSDQTLEGAAFSEAEVLRILRDLRKQVGRARKSKTALEP